MDRQGYFKSPVSKADVPDYYDIIKQPIAMSTIRKRITSNYYKSVLDFWEDFRLMFNNARTYNQEGSWVYNDAEEMEKIFNATFERTIAGSDLPGAPPPSVGAAAAYEGALTPMDEDERPPPSRPCSQAPRPRTQSTATAPRRALRRSATCGTTSSPRSWMAS